MSLTGIAQMQTPLSVPLIQAFSRLLQIAQQLFDTWYADAASFTGPTARRTCITAIAAAIRAERERCAALAEQTTRGPMDYRGWSPGPAADDRAHLIAAMIRTPDETD